MPSWEVNFDLRLVTGAQNIVEDLAKIHALSSVIRGIPIPPLVQQRLDRLNIMRAVRGTTGIEGTELSEEEVSQIVDSPIDIAVLGPDREREEQETRNANALMQFVGEYIKNHPDAPLTEPLLLQFHEILTAGINYEYNEPGRYRSHAVNVGPYRPPSTREEVRDLMTAFFTWFNTGIPSTWDPVLKAIIAHFYVVSIHPFGDGNGRTSRAVESFLLYKAGVNVRGYYSLANYYYQHRDEYIYHLNDIQMRGGSDLTPFASFALKGLVQELEAVHNEVLDEVRVLAFRDYARRTLADVGKLGNPAGQRQLQLLTELASRPVSVKALRSGSDPLARLYRGVTPKTLARDLNYLKEQNLVSIAGDELRARVDLMTQFTA